MILKNCHRVRNVEFFVSCSIIIPAHPPCLFAQPAYAAERSSFANCIQCSCNFLCSSFTNSLYGCTCKLSRSPNAQLRGLDCFFFLPGLLQALNKLVLLLAYFQVRHLFFKYVTINMVKL